MPVGRESVVSKHAHQNSKGQEYGPCCNPKDVVEVVYAVSEPEALDARVGDEDELGDHEGYARAALLGECFGPKDGEGRTKPNGEDKDVAQDRREVLDEEIVGVTGLSEEVEVHEHIHEVREDAEDEAEDVREQQAGLRRPGLPLQVLPLERAVLEPQSSAVLARAQSVHLHAAAQAPELVPFGERPRRKSYESVRCFGRERERERDRKERGVEGTHSKT